MRKLITFPLVLALLFAVCCASRMEDFCGWLSRTLDRLATRIGRWASWRSV